MSQQANRHKVIAVPTPGTPGVDASSDVSSLPGQGLRFAIAGGMVALLYVAVTTILADPLGVPFQVALVVGFATAVSAHFTLQRVFVWVHTDGFALPVRWQAGRYLGVAVLQYAVTALSTALLPGALGIRTLFVYLGTAFVITCANFLVFRARVFHPNVAPARPR